MRTFVADLHGGLARLGTAAPLLYPYRAAGELEVLMEAAGRPLGEVADEIRVALLRDYRPRVQLVLVIDLRHGMVAQVARIRAELLAALEAGGLRPARVVVVAVDALAREAHTGVPQDAAARAAWEADARALAEGGPSALAGLLVLRYALQRAPEPAYQRHLIHLAYLLAVLVELFGDEEIRQERLYSVDEVALDGTEAYAWLGAYERCLARAQREAEHALAHPEPVELALIEDPHCGCSRVLETLQLRQKTFGWLRGTDDVQGWRGWWSGTGTALAAHAAAGEDVVRRCMREWRGRVFETTERSVASIADYAAEARETLHAARRALAAQARPRGDAPEWEREMQRLTPRVQALIEARPRPQAFLLFTSVLLVLLVAPLLMTMPPGAAGGRMATAVLVLAGAAGAAWWVLRGLRAGLHDETHVALERASEIRKDVQEGVERGKRHLETLCAVEVARRNDAAAQQAAAAAGERTLLLKFHVDALRQHRERAAAFARNTAPGLPALGAAAEGDGAPPVELRIHLPPHESAVYAPALCAGAPQERPYEVRIRAGATVIRRASSRIRGLLHLQLADDVLYRPVRGAASTPDAPPPARGGG